MKLIASTLFALALSGAAVAQQQPAAETQHSPCQRSNTRMKFGGVDMDEMRCQLAVAGDAYGLQARQTLALQARVVMIENELAAEKKRADDAEAKFKSTEPEKSP